MLTRLLITLTLALIAAIITICILFADVILIWLQVAGIIGLIFLGGAGMITLAIGAFRALGVFEEWQDKRVTRQQKGLMIVQDGIGQSFLIRAKDDIVALTTNPGFFINGKASEPTQAELMMQALFFQAIGKGHASQLPPPASDIIIEQQTDLLTLIDQYPHTLIWGGTGGGKTSLLRTIAHRRKLQGHQVLVLDSREHPAKWTGLERMETEGKINRSIEILFKILRQNVEALREGKAVETDFKQITVITDEWTEIVAENEIARQFISEMVRQSRKYGIYLVFATQTDLAMDLGLDGRYKTINGFLRLELKKLNENYVAAAKVGLGQKLGEFPVPIPPPVPMIAPTGYLAPGLETTRPDSPNSDEQTILDLLAQDKSYRQISQEMWGGVGSWYNQKIKAIAQKYSVRGESN